jgi:hypothetical protein
MKLLVGLPVIVGSLLLAGCGKSEYQPVAKPATPKKEYKIDPNNYANLFPFAEGNSWTYNLESTAQNSKGEELKTTAEFEYRVKTLIKESDTAKRVILEIYRDGEVKDEQEWMVDSTGLYQLSLGASRKAFRPKQIVLKFPIQEKDLVKWEGTGPVPNGGEGKMKYEFKTDQLQPIDTDVAGESMMGLFVENAGSFVGPKGEGILAQNTWYVPGVGLARYKQVVRVNGGEAVITLRLKSYTVK